MDPEKLARTIAKRDAQIEQLSYKLLGSLNTVRSLEQELERLDIENATLMKKIEKKSISINQEQNDIVLLRKKIETYNKKTWSDTFSGIKSWLGSKMPSRFSKKSVEEKSEAD